MHLDNFFKSSKNHPILLATICWTLLERFHHLLEVCLFYTNFWKSALGQLFLKVKKAIQNGSIWFLGHCWKGPAICWNSVYFIRIFEKVPLGQLFLKVPEDIQYFWRQFIGRCWKNLDICWNSVYFIRIFEKMQLDNFFKSSKNHTVLLATVCWTLF